uniref:Phorbol-ester/DAG-type domain-containing protein n=1 Tax=Octopus bimaculoides TaxID=37653 RepID=A0A0L8G6D7_OCTBM
MEVFVFLFQFFYLHELGYPCSWCPFQCFTYWVVYSRVQCWNCSVYKIFYLRIHHF